MQKGRRDNQPSNQAGPLHSRVRKHSRALTKVLVPLEREDTPRAVVPGVLGPVLLGLDLLSLDASLEGGLLLGVHLEALFSSARSLERRAVFLHRSDAD